MKEEQNSISFNHHHHSNKKSRLLPFKLHPSIAAYVILSLLTYTLGYLSSSWSSSLRLPPPPSPAPTTTATPVFNNNFPTLLDNFRVNTRCGDPIPSGQTRQTILDQIYNNTSPYQNFPPAHVSKLLHNKRVKGWGSYGAVFEHLIKKVKPEVIIEVGTFLGASALHMAKLTRDLGLPTQIFCVDDFRGWPGFRDKIKYVDMINGDVLMLYQFMQNVAYWNATESVLPVPFSTGSALDKLCEWGVFGDLIEIDAGHDFNSAWADINRAYRILKPGGVIFGHDYFTAADNRGVRRAVNLFAEVNGVKVKTDGEHWVIDSTEATGFIS
ncbi:S-adenosyl-L-methionine-dependent methyltransferases superfamily protein [Euphorbia peplus]|nr:S-adenosyl-L-methionine-dependent methyltransferases superfamily protein [Euphorbia peplus]